MSPYIYDAVDYTSAANQDCNGSSTTNGKRGSTEQPTNSFERKYIYLLSKNTYAVITDESLNIVYFLSSMKF